MPEIPAALTARLRSSKLHDVATPAPGDGGVLVRARAAAVNPGDRHLMRDSPSVFRAVAGLTRPKDLTLGNDFAGDAEAVGKGVSVPAGRPGLRVPQGRVRRARHRARRRPAGRDAAGADTSRRLSRRAAR
ncbi:hypothetical protein AB0K67_15160 [Nonomuraea sp. NPDC052634]|uniref:alcohol dehydrogenase catalytic domain-containing protein n=1 Tax=Nonomuraea sp. NPDC052634 TaxID=3155813 RepID=UPI00343FB99A